MTGLTAQIDTDSIQIIPVVNAKVVASAAQRLEFGGNLINQNLKELLEPRGLELGSTPKELELLREIRDKHCYFALSTMREGMKYQGQNPKSVKIELPDGTTIEAGVEVFKAVEVLFKPKTKGVESEGLQSAISKAIKACDQAQRKNLISNILVSGEGGNLAGLDERLKLEISKVLGQGSKDLKIVVPTVDEISPWIGASMLTAYPTFAASWVKKDEFLDEGAAVIDTKCR